MASPEELAAEAAACTRCDLYQPATATVLRVPDGTAREEAFSGLVADLALARGALAS